MKMRLGWLAFCLVAMTVVTGEGFVWTRDASACSIGSPPSQCFTNADCLSVCGPPGGACHRLNSCQRVCYCIA